MPLGLSPVHLILILVIALIVVGPGKLPDVGAALGKSIKEFRKAASDVQEATSLMPSPPAAAPAPAPPPAPMQAAPVATPLAPAPPVAVAAEGQLVQPATSPAEAAAASSEAGA